MTTRHVSLQLKLFSAFMLVISALGPMLLLVIAHDWNWIDAWFIFGIYVITILVSRLIVWYKHPDLLSERARSIHASQVMGWDKAFLLINLIFQFPIWVIGGLDRLYTWSPPLSIGIKIIGYLMVVAGSIISVWAMSENRFFSGIVRIQSDRGHNVINSGPYRFVRHPGYLGGFLLYIGIPLSLESLWMLVPIFIIMIALVFRIIGEDRFLIQKLPGYLEYTRKTKFRLIPGLW